MCELHFRRRVSHDALETLEIDYDMVILLTIV